MATSFNVELFLVIGIFSPANYLLSCHGESSVILRHPYLLGHYLHRRRPFVGNATFRGIPFSEMGKSFVCKQCLRLIQINTFQLTNEGETQVDASARPLDGRFTKYDVRRFMKMQNNIRKSIIKVEGVRNGVQVIQCAELENESLYIENGVDTDEYFIFTLIRGSGEPIIELAIQAPRITWNTAKARLNVSRPEIRNEQECGDYIIRRENEFIRTLRIGFRSRKRIQTVVGLDRVKLCVTLYHTWIGSMNGQDLAMLHLIRRMDDSSFKVNVNLCFLSNGSYLKYAPFITHYPAEIIPCSVSTASNSPDFYVAADQDQKDAVFLLSEMKDRPNVYVVIMRVNNVLAIKHYFLEPTL